MKCSYLEFFEKFQEKVHDKDIEVETKQVEEPESKVDDTDFSGADNEDR